MTVPSVRSAYLTYNESPATTHTVNMPVTITAGDLLVCLFVHDGNPTITWDNTTYGTWTLVESFVTGSDYGARIYAKVATGSEAGGTLSVTTSAAEISGGRNLAIKDWAGTIATDVNCPAEYSTTGSTTDPPAATDSWGTVDRRTFVLAGTGNGTSTLSSYPSGYTDDQHFEARTGTTSSVSILVCSKGGTEGSQNPGTATFGASVANFSWTLSVKGATAAATSFPPRRRSRNFQHMMVR